MNNTANTSNPAGSRFTHAVISRVPDVFAKHYQHNHHDGNGAGPPRSAREQQSRLTAALRSLGVDVLEMPPDESSAESAFAEDLAVVVNGIALLCRPGPHRAAELNSVRAVLRKELGQRVVEPTSSSALLSGADVLFTGREFFVGLSQWSNTEGAVAVAATWPEYPCTPVRVDGGLHLKSHLSVAGPDVLAVGAGPQSQAVLRRVEREATHRYQTLTLPEDRAANCLFVNGTLIHRCKEDAPKSDPVFSAKVDFPRIALSASEFDVAQRSISSLFIMVRKSKHLKRL